MHSAQQTSGLAQYVRPGKLQASPSLTPCNIDSKFIERLEFACRNNLPQTLLYSNEIYLFFLIPLFEAIETLKKNSITDLSIKYFRGPWILYVSAAKNAGIHTPFLVRFASLLCTLLLLTLSVSIVLASSVILPLLVILFIRRPITPNSLKKISVVRSFAAYEKTKYLENEGWVFLSGESFFRNERAGSIYGYGSHVQRLIAISVVPFKSIRDFTQIVVASIKIFGFWNAGGLAYYFSKRVAEANLFEYYLVLIFRHNTIENYVTSNKEDRFALIEKRVGVRYNIKIICIPHGIEYAFRMPGGLVGDTFYCTTVTAKRALERLYPKQQKFVFDANIARKMFSKGLVKEKPQKIVFFTEARGADINRSIIAALNEGESLPYLKLHPKDSYENYNDIIPQHRVIQDFSLAITNNICIARKSTVLIEALYNHSTPLSILVCDSDKDFVHHMLPSLLDSQIKRIYSLTELSKRVQRMSICE